MTEEITAPALHKEGKLVEALEAMLFVSAEPVTLSEFSGMLNLPEKEIEEALETLKGRLTGSVTLAQIAGGYRLCTAPEYEEYCRMILQPASKKLSKAAFETLAIIAYRQPCTVPEAEAVRGVAVGGPVKTLMDRGLIKEAGRRNTPGKPMQYATTPEFLEYFGLNTIDDLPDIDEIKKTVPPEPDTVTLL